jgi:hypothetical protein
MKIAKANPKNAKGAPRHAEQNAKGGKANPFGQRPVKADLVARMKAAAEESKKDD